MFPPRGRTPLPGLLTDNGGEQGGHGIEPAAGIFDGQCRIGCLPHRIQAARNVGGQGADDQILSHGCAQERFRTPEQDCGQCGIPLPVPVILGLGKGCAVIEIAVPGIIVAERSLEFQGDAE